MVVNRGWCGNRLVRLRGRTTPEKLGNFTFGYIGASLGLPLVVLTGGSVVAAAPFRNTADIRNELGDWGDIRQGFTAFWAR